MVYDSVFFEKIVTQCVYMCF